MLTLSLGYYHEQPEDASFDALLLAPLRLLGRYGVCVVASAGNDATSRPSYPAAFAPADGGLGADAGVAAGGQRRRAQPGRDRRAVQQRRAVGALLAPGGVPREHPADHLRRLRGGAQRAGRRPSRQRAALDPDDFTAGFAVWSGTSFAAPVLAGQLAERLLQESGQQPPGDPAARVRRGRAALASLPEIGARP